MSLATLVLLAHAAEPHASHPERVSANGYGVLVFDGQVASLFSDHLYEQYQPGQEPTRDLLYDGYFGIPGAWLTQADAVSLVPGTNIVKVERSSRPTEDEPRFLRR